MTYAIALPPHLLMHFLKAVVKQVGEVSISSELDMADYQLLFEGSEDGETITFSVVRVDEEGAGHA